MSDLIFDFSSKRAQLTPDKIAFKTYSTGQTISFAQFEINAIRLAAILSDNGIIKTDRVAILCRNRVEFFEALFACAKTGAILVPLNWRAPAPELAPLIELSGAKLILYGQEEKEIAKQIGAKIAQIGFDENYQSLLDAKDVVMAYANIRTHWPKDEVWYLLYTSGTTGTPKAVIQTYGMALVNAINLGQAIDIRADDCFVNFLPLFHTAGINLHTIPAFFNGCMSWILNGFEIDAVLDLIQSNSISAFFGVPAVYLQISNHSNFNNLKLDNVRHWGCGGAPLADYLVHKFAQKNVLVCNGMGMTETGPTAFMMDSQSVLSKIGSVGKPQILVEAKIFDSNLNEVLGDEAGELAFSGPGITPGYWQNESANAAAFIIDEKTQIRYLRTGDLASRDKDGYFYITGRAKEMYISGGENVYPMEVENILSLHEAIDEVAIIGVPSDKWGETGAAFFMTSQKISEEELREYCKKRLASFKIPSLFIEVSEFPRTAAGKIQKHLLRLPEVDKEAG